MQAFFGGPIVRHHDLFFRQVDASAVSVAELNRQCSQTSVRISFRNVAAEIVEGGPGRVGKPGSPLLFARQLFCDMLNVVDQPLATLPDSMTRPPKEVLDACMEELR